MAEFQEVMRQWKRLCIEMGHRYGVNACANCPCSQDEDAICDAIYDTPKDTNWPFIEIAVVSWAAEHPEPVYPTWGEWLVTQGILTEYGPTGCGSSGGICGILTKKGLQPIHADIAQKLGIEPKEG